QQLLHLIALIKEARRANGAPVILNTSWTLTNNGTNTQDVVKLAEYWRDLVRENGLEREFLQVASAGNLGSDACYVGVPHDAANYGLFGMAAKVVTAPLTNILLVESVNADPSGKLRSGRSSFSATGGDVAAVGGGQQMYYGPAGNVQTRA